MPVMEKQEKIRLDQLLVKQQLADTTIKAQAIIMAGKVLVNEQKETKPGTTVSTTAILRLLGETSKYVSRGGLKLEGALKEFGINALGKFCLDIGASTGGFTDCLLQQGATHVIALDVGHSQLDWKIRSEKRVTVIEKYNFRNAKAEDFAENKITLATIDVSFISLDKILPALFPILASGGEVVSLVKPQFEAKREQVGPGGIITDPTVHTQVREKIREVALALGFTILGECQSSIQGTDGNTEFFIYLQKPN